MSLEFLKKRIVRTPGICGGQPRIEGHRIRVKDIVKWFEILGMKADEIADSYDLSLADIYLAMAYYHANREELSKEWDKELLQYQQIRKENLSQLVKFRKDGSA